MDRAREAFDDTRDFARDGAEETGAFIHERPVASTLMGVGAGVILGLAYGSLRSRPTPAERRPARASRGRGRKSRRA
jgi:ElaB/YqjD/DUF883 family membrane-anchored ribosome-binding protein